MGIGTSIFLIAAGAVLAFAIHVSVSGVSLHTIGLILMAVGAVGLVLSLIWAAMAGRRRRVYDAYDRPYVP